MMNQQIEILLVEDNKDEAHFITRGLEQLNLGKKIFSVADGTEALDFIFAKNKYSGQTIGRELKLILLDLNVPKTGGLEILKQIKNDERTMSIPVVVLTSSKEEKDHFSAYQLGANSYLIKPVNYSSFTKELEHVVNYWMFLNQPALV